MFCFFVVVAVVFVGVLATSPENFFLETDRRKVWPLCVKKKKSGAPKKFDTDAVCD